ncbi:DnaJ domain-containing protein [Mycena alexandri]|uniref:Diphthamide biosynthesis protein 4 n=1 Tax=Mycena alexandri TaxID=1745969 RepID=A0AAD6WMT9_9AGAR|nr:DnaJ domain-containing protein [Mycena alexandri]
MNDDYYKLLAVHRSASPKDIKAAYHRALLAAHPDKNPDAKSKDIHAIQQAYRVLSDPARRAQHDTDRQRMPAGPRPAQVISLAEFDEVPEHDRWTHACRCGGNYAITGADMERGMHLVPCTSCSEVVWVGYELVEE